MSAVISRSAALSARTTVGERRRGSSVKRVASATHGRVNVVPRASASLSRGDALCKRATARSSANERRVTVQNSSKRSSVRANASGALEEFKAKYPQAETVFYFAAWYFLNVQFNIINKTIYNYFPFPWFVSCVHLFVGLFIMAFFWGSKLVEYEQPDKDFLKALSLPAFLHAFGHCLTNVSFATVAVSFTHTVKTLEPVFTAIGSYLVAGTVYPLPVYASLLPIMGGVAIASATELSFTWLGFLTAMSSNVAFSARAIFSKKLMNKMSPLNLYNWVTIVALMFCLPFAIYFEGPTLAQGISDAIALKGKTEFLMALASVGFYYHMYNQVAYQALGKVAPVTHAVGNVGKRIFVIGFSILAFGNKISTQTAVGSLIAILGAGIYGVVKGKYAKNN
ncbi:Triose-phosphate transporter domain [Ostreococcus tauri]|uniref:Triose-phosphate transporter domain n=1 Tax=Ostreococcus tauri TaxID=70448 RepID=A0A096PA22_OSTTA|nr:Triose-phosphate transporter domain [Ostreococcus tauri]CEG01787.1 Triose-phosphate transporter domain [Ostreococcus tauri]|eukprot:XP_022841169.1 Triose-phosphate transporter domain [Ostreococcus tauri]